MLSLLEITASLRLISNFAVSEGLESRGIQVKTASTDPGKTPTLSSVNNTNKYDISWKKCGLDVLNPDMSDVWNALYDSETNVGRGSRGDTITLKWCAFV